MKPAINLQGYRAVTGSVDSLIPGEYTSLSIDDLQYKKVISNKSKYTFQAAPHGGGSIVVYKKK